MAFPRLTAKSLKHFSEKMLECKNWSVKLQTQPGEFYINDNFLNIQFSEPVVNGWEESVPLPFFCVETLGFYCENKDRLLLPPNVVGLEWATSPGNIAVIAYCAETPKFTNGDRIAVIPIFLTQKK